MSKPIIGVMPLWDDEKESLWMLPGYFDGIRHAGGIPIMLPLTDDEQDLEQLVEACEGFLFTGGHDVTPELYSETVLEAISELCRNKTLLVIAHRLKTIRDADQILVVSGGEITERGDHTSLMEENGSFFLKRK